MHNLRSVSEEEGRDLARSFGLDYFEASAKNGGGVAEAFGFLVNKIFASMEITPNFLKRTKESFLLACQDGAPSRKKRCC